MRYRVSGTPCINAPRRGTQRDLYVDATGKINLRRNERNARRIGAKQENHGFQRVNKLPGAFEARRRRKENEPKSRGNKVSVSDL